MWQGRLQWETTSKSRRPATTHTVSLVHIVTFAGHLRLSFTSRNHAGDNFYPKHCLSPYGGKKRAVKTWNDSAGQSHVAEPKIMAWEWWSLNQDCFQQYYSLAENSLSLWKKRIISTWQEHVCCFSINPQHLCVLLRPQRLLYNLKRELRISSKNLEFREYIF